MVIVDSIGVSVEDGLGTWEVVEVLESAGDDETDIFDIRLSIVLVLRIFVAVLLDVLL